MQDIPSVRDADISGKRVLLRVDFNVPLENGAVADDTRIKAALPTIGFLLTQGAAEIVLLTHLGRPEGKPDPRFDLAPVEKRFAELISAPNVHFYQNLRFNPGEEANDPAFAKQLADLGDLFVQDAFADLHRPHASIVGVAALLPSYAGFLVEEEIMRLSEALQPAHPAVAIIGGAKFETKEPLLQKLLTIYDRIFVGGAVGDDIIKARGLPFGASLVSGGPVSPALAVEERLVVPQDVVVLESEKNAERTALVIDIREQESVVDVGPKTAQAWSDEVENAQFVLWNGPLGVYEKGYVDGTDAIANALVHSKCKAVVGGGDTDAALEKFSFDPTRVFVSTGGGAMLQFLAEGTLPGIEALRKHQQGI